MTQYGGGGVYVLHTIKFLLFLIPIYSTSQKKRLN